ncbi:MAG: lipoprotein [Oscillospiraceae bacterium]
MKKTLTCFLAVFLTLSLSACGGSGNTAATEPSTSSSTVSQPEQNSGREEATEYVFTLSEGEEKTVENLLFREDVTISGDNAYIEFINCEFLGDVINTADVATAVYFTSDTVTNGVCILHNNTKEATIDTPIPKFITEVPIEVVCEDCAGNIVVLGDIEIVRNGVSYTMADAEYFYDSEAGLVPYEGQEASCLWVAQWWENGEQIDIVCCE